jgi:hypothetical protein
MPIGQLHVNAADQTVLLRLEGAERLSPAIQCRGQTFRRKSELHVTVIDRKVKLGNKTRVVDALKEAARGMTIAVERSGDYRLVRKQGRQSIVEIVAAPGLEAYYLAVEQRLDLPPGTIPRAAPHVTLYIEPKADPAGRGIAVRTQAELDAAERLPGNDFTNKTQ